MSEEHAQAQPIRPGDVYPPSAADHEARRDRHKIVDAHRQQHDGGLRVTETDLPAGKLVVTATASGQVMAQFTVPVPDREVVEATDTVTIGEALQAAAQASDGDRSVDAAVAAAVQAAEMRATGLAGVVPGGVAAAAQQAAETNMKPETEDEKVRLRDVVGSAAAVLPADKVASAAGRNAGKGRADEDGVSGVAQAVAAAAEMNEERMMIMQSPVELPPENRRRTRATPAASREGAPAARSTLFSEHGNRWIELVRVGFDSSWRRRRAVSVVWPKRRPN